MIPIQNSVSNETVIFDWHLKSKNDYCSHLKLNSILQQFRKYKLSTVIFPVLRATTCCIKDTQSYFLTYVFQSHTHIHTYIYTHGHTKR